MAPGETGANGSDVVGLDIGDGLMTAARVRPLKDGRLSVTHVGWEEYDVGASDRQIAGAIRRLWRRHALSTFSVSSCLRCPSLTLKYFKYPGLSGVELASALRLEAEQALQMPPEKIALDWHVARRPSAATAALGGDEGTEGVLVAAPRVEVERHLELLRMAGLYPVVLDVGTLAAGNLLAAVGETVPASTAICLISLGRRLADIAILYEGDFVYPRSVFSRGADWRTVPDQLAGHFQDMVKYSQFKLRQEPVKRVVLCGRVPAEAFWTKTFSEGIGVPVELWNPLSQVAVGVRASRALSGDSAGMGPSLATCLGLALRST